MLRKKHRTASRRLTAQPTAAVAPAVSSTPRLLPLGALAAGFGLLQVPALAQTAPKPAAPASAASAPAATAAEKKEATLTPIAVKAKAESDATSVRATTTTIGKGTQELRDIPQSVTVVTEKLIEDRRVDTLKEALHQTAGVTFMAAEGGEEDIRLRGFSLAASGDIYVDGLRDPAFYERDTFSFDRVELLRGSASMLFGRGSTGGVVNQVSKVPFLNDATEVNWTLGSHSYMRLTGDFNVKLGERTALRLNVMKTDADNNGAGSKIDKQGIAPTLRWGIGTNDEFMVGLYALENNNGINYGMPWLRANSASATPAGLIPIDPKNYYGAASDYNKGGVTYGTFNHVHRFGESGGMLKTTVRHGNYYRDQRASTIRFMTAATGEDNLTDATRLVRGGALNGAANPNYAGNNKVQDMGTTYAQSDYSNTFKWFGLKNEVLTGVDFAHEVFHNYALTTPAGVTLNKNATPITVGSPDDGSGWVDESLRIKRMSGSFDAKALGVYFQDLVEVAPGWKVLGGLRWDYFKGSYQTYQTADGGTAAVGTQLTDRSRSDRLWSKRVGVLYQPNDAVSYYASYGTSFNTSGDTYQYDDLTKNTPPESSENYELGGKLDAFGGNLSARVAAFYSIKKNERNRDSDSAATAYLLSGKRHAAGLEIDLAGRITPAWEVYGSYAWIPSAKIDEGAPDGTTLTQGERVGDRPSLTPRHSGTIWTTYQLTPQWRLGGGLNARSSQTPNRNPVGIVAPHYVTGDLLAEYTYSEAVSFKLNINNVTNKLYADALYTGHYIPGAGRMVYLTMTGRF
ncbi:MAG TPA: TonB-dependent siderophore receptor [Burkholderiaceae bacterium]|nr:TonB-dependent siderophore receptor [Burkholderiaceae bacterium]